MEELDGWVEEARAWVAARRPPRKKIKDLRWNKPTAQYPRKITPSIQALLTLHYSHSHSQSHSQSHSVALRLLVLGQRSSLKSSTF